MMYESRPPIGRFHFRKSVHKEDFILSQISSHHLCFSHFLYIFSVCFQQYKNPEVAKRDVLNVFTHFNDLRPKQDDFGKYNHL